MASSVAESAGSIVAGCRRLRGDETPEPVPRTTQHPSPNMSPKTPDRISPSLKADACFSCGQEGHWSRYCPSKERGGGAQLGADTGAVDVPNCYCGERCVVLISKTDKNPGRKYFRCSNPIMLCKFFQWCDSSTPQPHMSSPAQQCPNLGNPVEQDGVMLQEGGGHPCCHCGAGWCKILTMSGGERAGQKYFACLKDKCDFILWCDEVNLVTEGMTKPIVQDVISPQCNNASIQCPNCTCGAGRCRLLTTEHGEYAGRMYFGCPVKKGQGACKFHQWLVAAEGDAWSVRNLAGGNKSQTSEQRMGAQRDTQQSFFEPTLLNFDDVEMVKSNVGTHRTPQGTATASYPSPQACQPSLRNSRPDVLPKPGKCYRCGKEGHWAADCLD